MRTTDNQLIKTNTLILGVFIFFFITKLFYWLPRDVFGNSINSWVYTDWLIDYSSGFIRRGLSGELINLISTIAPPRAIIGFLTWLIFGAVVFGYVRLCTRALSVLSPFLLVAMLFLPSLLPFYLYDHGAFGRKETIGFLFLLCHLYSLEKNGNAKALKISDTFYVNKYIKSLLFVTVILLPMHVFVHESSFFLFVPIHVIITYSILRLDPSKNLKQRLSFLTFIYLPVLVAFFIVFFFGRANIDVAQAICKKWELANALKAGSCNISGKNTMWALPGALTALGWSFSQAVSLTLSFSVKTILAWILIFSILGFSTAYIVGRVSCSFIKQHFNDIFDTTLARRHSKIMCYKYFLLPLIISLPLYIVGWDLGRWFAVSCINFAIIGLSRDINYADFIVRNDDKAAARIQMISQTFLVKNRFYHIKLFFLLLIVFFIRMPHCCNKGFNIFAEPIKSLARKIIISLI